MNLKLENIPKHKSGSTMVTDFSQSQCHSFGHDRPKLKKLGVIFQNDSRNGQ